MGLVRGEPLRSAPVKVLVSRFAMTVWGSDECVRRAETALFIAPPCRSACSPDLRVQGRGPLGLQ